MSLKKDLNELLTQRIISEETAHKIANYYHQKAGENKSRLLTVFALLGVLLIGAGILLIIAYNWDMFSVSQKSILAFIPLVLGQIFGFYVLKYKYHSLTWRESAALIISFGIIIAFVLTSQIYHLNEDFSHLLLWWILLSIPLIYLFKSQSLGLFLFVLSNIYLFQNFHKPSKYFFLLFLFFLLLYYYQIEKTKNEPIIYFYRWIVSFSILIFLFSFFVNPISLLSLMGIFSLMFLCGVNKIKEESIFKNPYKWIGLVGIIALFLANSFRSFWKETDKFFELEGNWKPELIILSILILFYLYCLLNKKNKNSEIDSFSYFFILFIIFYILGAYFSFTFVLANIAVLGIGLRLMMYGEQTKRLDFFNLGLLSVLILIILHFFSNDIPFIYRGIAFILTGSFLIGINYFMIRRFGNEK